MRRVFGFVVGVLAMTWSVAAFAAPVTWYVTGTLTGGGTVSGSFVYDVNTNTYSSVNLVTTAGTLPGAAYTVSHPASGQSVLVANTVNGAVAGQPVIALGFSPFLSNAGGTVAVTNREGICNTGCTDYDGATRDITATATTVAPVTVPTMTEWAMILFGVLLAGFAAVSIQRRRQVG